LLYKVICYEAGRRRIPKLRSLQSSSLAMFAATLSNLLNVPSHILITENTTTMPASLVNTLITVSPLGHMYQKVFVSSLTSEEDDTCKHR